MSKSDCSPPVSSKWFSSLFPQSLALKEDFRSYLTWNLSYDLGMKSLDLMGREGGSFFNDLILCEAASLLQAGSDTKLQVFAVCQCHQEHSPSSSYFFSRQPRGSTEDHLHQTASCCCPGWGQLINMSFSGGERSGWLSRKYFREKKSQSSPSGFREGRLPLQPSQRTRF